MIMAEQTEGYRKGIDRSIKVGVQTHPERILTASERRAGIKSYEDKIASIKGKVAPARSPSAAEKTDAHRRQKLADAKQARRSQTAKPKAAAAKTEQPKAATPKAAEQPQQPQSGGGSGAR
jgi:hypothetical protein